jgi:hypothetical protein
MNTDPKTNTPVQGLKLHPELASPDTNQRRLYEVTVHRTDYRYIKVRVWATSEASAENTAERIAHRRNDREWNVADRDLYAYSVEQVQEGGQIHE